MANLVGDLGKQLSDSVSKSLSGFAAGMKSAAIAGNPAVFGPAFNKLEKLFKDDIEEKKRALAFEEEKALEQRKLFIDILGEQKETNSLLENILKALTPKEESNLFRNALLAKLIAKVIGLTDALKAFGEFLKALPFKILGFLEDLLRGLLKPLDFLKDIVGRIGGILDFIKDLFGRFGSALSRLLDFLGDLLDKLRVRFPSLDNIFKFFEDLPKRFGDFFKDIFDRFKKLPFVEDIIKFFSDLPNRFIDGFNRVLDTFRTAFDDFRTKFRIPSFDDILKAFDDFKTKIRLPNFDDIIRAIEGTFDALPASFDRLRNATLINVAILADLLDEVKANLGAKFDTFKTTFFDSFGKVGSLIDDLSLKFDSLRTSTSDFFGRITAAFQDGRLALSIEDLGKIMPEILGTSGGFFEAMSARFGYYFQQIVEAGQRAIKFIEEVSGPYLKILGEIGAKILKFLIPIDIVLSIFDGFMLATSEEKIAEYLNKDELQVSFMDRIAAFLGGSISSFIFGFFDLAVKLVDWIAGNIFGSQTWEESANLGLQKIFDEGLTVFFEQMVSWGKEIFYLLKGLFTLDGEIIQNALKEMWYIFDDFVVNIVNTMERALDAIGVRKYLARAYNFIGSSIVGVLNSVMQFFSNVTTWIADKLGSLPDFLGGAKFREFATNYKYTPITFQAVDEKYDKNRDSIVSERQRQRGEAASELKRESRGKPAPDKKPSKKPTAPQPKTGFSSGYTPTGSSFSGGANQPPLSVRNNNPGNLKFANQAGAIGADSRGFAIFDSPESGMAAMRRQIELDTQTRGMTLGQFINKYAPPSDNNPTAQYIQNMSAATGLGPNDRIPASAIPALQTAMIRQEGGDKSSQFYAGVPSSTSSNWPSMVNASYNPAVSYGGSPGGDGGGRFGVNPFYNREIAGGVRGPIGEYVGPLSGTEQTYIRNEERIREEERNRIASKVPSTTASTSQSVDATLVSLNKDSNQTLNDSLDRIEEVAEGIQTTNRNQVALNEMESQNLVYTQQMAQGIQQLNEYQQQRKNLEMQFLGQVSNDISKAIYKSLGPGGVGVTGPQTTAFNSITQLYQGAFNNFSTKLLGKDLGPAYANIFSQLAASYTDQFVNQVLGPMFGPNAAQGFNRAINNYAQGASARKQYDLLKQDYDKMQSDFKQLSSQVTLVDRLNALKPVTAKPSQEKLNLINQIDTMEKALAQKGIQVGKAKKAKDANMKMVYEDLIFGMTGIPTGMRSMLGYEQGIQNFSQQMALMIGQPISGAFGGSGGYEEYKRQVERQMKLGIDAQGRAMEQGALQVRDGMFVAGDYHNQGFGNVTAAHLLGYAQINQANLQTQAQIFQQHAQMLSQMQFGGYGGGQSFLGMLFDKGINYLAGSIFGGGGSTTFNPMNFPSMDDEGNMMPGYGINQETGDTYWNPYTTGPGGGPIAGYGPGSTTITPPTTTTGIFDTIGQGFKDITSSVGDFFSGMFGKGTSPTGGGGTIAGVTGPVQLGGPGMPGGGLMPTRPGFSFGDMLTSMGGQFLGTKLGSMLGIKGTSFGGMLLQAGINQTVTKVLGNVMAGQPILTGLSNIPMAFANVGKGLMSPQIGMGNMISKIAGSEFLTNLAPGFAGSLGQFGAAMANPAIFSSGASLGTSQMLGSLAGGAMSGMAVYGLSNLLSGGYSVGNNTLSKVAGLGAAASTLGLFGSAGSLGIAAGAGGLGGLFSGAAGLLGTNPLGLALLGVAVLGNRLFGRKAPKVVGEGITGTLAEGTGTSLQNYRDIFQKGGKFRSDKSWTEYSAADTELVKYMQASINDVFGGVREGAKIMGIDPNAVTGFTQQIKLNLQGMSQEKQAETLMNSLKNFSDAMLNHAYPALQQFTLEGERLFDTFSRLTQSTEFMNTAFEMLLYDAEDLAKTIQGKTGLELANLKYELMSMFGGETLQEQQDNFSKFVGDYYKLFYTQEEQLTFSMNQKKEQFDKLEEEIKSKINIPGLNIEIPEFKGTVEESRVAYREFIDNYVKSTGLATEDQRQIYAQLIQAAPMFYQGAQEFVALNAEKKKTMTREELIAKGANLIGEGASAAFSTGMEAGEGLFAGGFADVLNTAAGSLGYISTEFSATPLDGIITGDQIKASGSSQFLSEQEMMNTGEFLGPAPNVNTVVDNSVRSVSSPVTTFVMNDDKVRDFHPILRNVERTSLRAFSLAMR